MSILLSLFYFISFAALAAGIFLYRKCDTKLWAAVWLPVSAVSVMGYQTFAAAVMSLVNIRINILSIGIWDILAAALIWYVIIRGRRCQKYGVSKVDAAVWLVLVAAVIKVTLMRYGAELDIHYNSVDGAAHMISAMDVVNTGSVTTMFFAALHNALLIELLGPFVASGVYYKIYILGDILFLLLSGIMFWGLIKRYCRDNFLKVAGLIMAVLYMLGYPLNSMQFGFSYLGMCVTVIGCLMILLDGYIYDDLETLPMVVLMSLSCLSVFQSYVLFMPVVYFAILVCVLIKQYTKGKLISLNTVAVGAGIFLVPVAIGLWFTYRGIFGHSYNGGATVGSAINTEGGIYRDLFSNYVFLIPLAVLGIWSFLKSRKNNLAMVMLPMEAVFVAALFVMVLNQRASTYYFYKNYYLLWLIMFYLAFVGIASLESKMRIVIVSGFAVWCCIAGGIYFRINDYIENRAPLLYEGTEFSAFADIYDFNYKFLRTSRYDGEAVKLYRYAREELIDGGVTDEVPAVADWEDRYWMQAVTNQRFDDLSASNIKKQLKKGTYDYVIVLTESEDYASNSSFFDGLDKIYANDAGFIAKIN